VHGFEVGPSPSGDRVHPGRYSAPDELPLHEPRLGCAIAVAYDVAQPPTATEIGALAEQWRPYRTWCCLLLRAWLEGETHEIAG